MLGNFLKGEVLFWNCLDLHLDDYSGSSLELLVEKKIGSVVPKLAIGTSHITSFSAATTISRSGKKDKYDGQSGII